jgi:hypothetical protein
MFEATRKQWQRKVVQDQNDILYEHVYTSEVATFVLQKIRKENSQDFSQFGTCILLICKPESSIQEY